MRPSKRHPADNVIHVQFGAARRSMPAPVAPIAADDPVARTYARTEVARIVGVDVARLRTWERSGLVRPGADGPTRAERYYTFRDLVVVRTAWELVGRGVAVGRVRRVLDALRKTLPATARLSEMRIACDGSVVTARADGTTFDPLTGQVLFDFGVGALRDDVVRTFPEATPDRAARTATDHFLEGCRLDADESTRGRAEQSYRRALALDPTLACAYTNLGMVRLARNDAREAAALFRRAMALDPSQSEAPYNLGYIALAAGRHDEAAAMFDRAVQLDPDFADAHFNLAVSLEGAGRGTLALPHWSAYLDLEPDGPYARAARQRVRDEG